jgi:hypothetical protein
VTINPHRVFFIAKSGSQCKLTIYSQRVSIFSFIPLQKEISLVCNFIIIIFCTMLKITNVCHNYLSIKSSKMISLFYFGFFLFISAENGFGSYNISLLLSMSFATLLSQQLGAQLGAHYLVAL